MSKLLEHTSYGQHGNAKLVLEDGSVFEGYSCGASGEVYGEVCFNTSLEGYLEVISDPSYAGQIITMTYPQIGNYGVNRDDLQADTLALRGLVVHEMCFTPSNWRSEISLPDFLKEQNVVAIGGIDTRSLTTHLRDHGAQRGVLSTTDFDTDSLLAKVRASESIVGVNLAKTVSCSEPTSFTELPQSQSFALDNPKDPKYRVVAYDCGVKKSILQGLVRETYLQVEKLIGKVPLFGICLGHQMISLASGAEMEKLKFGHRGGNQPVMNLRTGRVEITAQNHGFGLLFDSLGPLVPELSADVSDHVRDLRFWCEKQCAPVIQNEKFGRIQLTHVNLNDGTAEGIAFLDHPVFSVQYHPEASPGPTDAHYLFTAFTRLMEGRSDYLDIDIAQDRLAGWKFGATEGEINA